MVSLYTDNNKIVIIDEPLRHNDCYTNSDKPIYT